MSNRKSPPLTNSAARVTRTPQPPARQVSASQRAMDAPTRLAPMGPKKG